MLRVLAAFAAFQTVAILAVGIFVVHGSTRDGCAQASAAASAAWTAVALADSGDRRLRVVAAADTALAHAAGEPEIGAARASRLPWAGDEAAMVAALRSLESEGAAAQRIELARRASAKAAAVCR